MNVNNPDLEDILKQVKDRSITAKSLKHKLDRSSAGHKRKGRKLNKGTEFYRTRVFDDESSLPGSVSDISFAPKEISKLGRANTPGNTVFYASVGMPTTLVESRVKPGQILVYGRWKTLDNLILQEVGFEDSKVHLENIYHTIFTNPDESMYTYSSVVAEHLLKGGVIQGIIYPSIINKNKAPNVAIKPEYVDDNMRLLYGTALYIESMSKDSIYKTKEINFALPSEDGILVWKGRKRKWVVADKEELKMVSNGWEWNAYKPDGSWASPE